ncbi:hypothetical protein [Rhizomonospora bruguierae]|uniref:hypothetical protein n=1 Tax=Rhizomonospora bruguierae TaxID=1581705 RepID=UPI001BCA9CA8|nr:hypothetical protein [Micromonospora sp. NBRC 107566]
MSSEGGGRYYWCVRHSRVETDADACPATDRMGPYASAAEAEGALSRVQERNVAWDAEDARWEGETD